MLAIPLGIFIFLRMFGENRFDIPVYHQQGVETPFGDCLYPSGQFTVPDTLISSRPGLHVFYSSTGKLTVNELNNQLLRLSSLFEGAMPKVSIFAMDTLKVSHGEVVILEPKPINILMNCGFATDIFNQYILVDEQGRIRGYFGSTLDEMDRLVVETKILIENGTREQGN